jgi:hypothetical protein
VWDDQPAVEAFRRSELYAKLVLSPFWDDGSDYDYAMENSEPERSLVLAA